MTGPSQSQHARMHVLWALANVHTRPERLALTGAIVSRTLATSNDLTSIEALDVIDYMSRLHQSGELVDRAVWWLDNFYRTSCPTQ